MRTWLKPVLAVTVAVPFTVPTAVNAAEADTFTEARESAAAAADLSTEERQQHYRAETVFTLTGNWEGSDELLYEVWTDKETGTATVRYEASGDLGNEVSRRQGSVTQYDKKNNRARLTPWVAITPKTKSDQRVMRHLPAGTEYVTGAIPQKSVDAPGYTARQLEGNAPSPGAFVEYLLSDCDEPWVTCDGTVMEENNRKTWQFTVNDTLDGVSVETEATLHSDSQGRLINYTGTTITTDDYGFSSTARDEVNANYRTAVPEPNITNSNTVNSRMFTRVAVEQGAKELAGNVKRNIMKYLNEQGRQVSKRNVARAFNYFYRNQMSIDQPTNQWVNIASHRGGYPQEETYSFYVTADTGLTEATRLVHITVKNGSINTRIAKT